MKRVTSTSEITQKTFSDSAWVLKTAQSGLSLQPIGPLNNAVRVGDHQPVVVFNSGATVAYVKFGPQSVSAPTGPADGIPIQPNEKYEVNSGNNEFIRSDSADVYGYASDNE
jgi:hypothetical protein